MLGDITPTEQGILHNAILQTYEIKGITTETENPGAMEMPTMHDLKNMLDSMAGGADLATRLERFTNGTFAGLFSDQTNVDLGSGLVTFCIRDLEEQLRPISMYILLNFIWNKIRSELKRRLLVVDEAWNIVQYEDSGRFLHGLVKRARKYYLGVTTITQDVEDFLDSRWGKPIIANSSLQVLLRQAPIAIEKLKKVFNLTEQEQYLLLNSGVGQGLFFAGNQHVAIQIIASHGEDKIITTNPKELLAQRNK
jgi:type IV secretory pathway VirB4 component